MSYDNNQSLLDVGNQSTVMINTVMDIDCSTAVNNCTNITTTPAATIAFPISMFLTGTIGNAIAIFVLYRNSRREQMKTVFYVLVGSLAWTDLIGIVLTSIPVLLVYLNGRWVGGTSMCNYHAFTMICIGLITPFTVCTMAIERYLGIRHGYFYKRHVNRSRACQVLLAQWIFVLLFTSLPLFGFGQYSLQYPKTWCFVNLHPRAPIDIAYTTMFAIITLILILITMACNIIVIGTLIGMRYRRQHLTSPSRERQFHRSPRQREIEIQMVILLVGITILFTTCWAPLMIQIIYNQIIDHGGNHLADILAVRLASVNQTFDPWVYILFRKVIFTKFWSFLRRLFSGPVQASDDEKKMAVAQQLLRPNGHEHYHGHQPIRCPCHVVNGNPQQPHRHNHHHHHCHCSCQCTCKPPRNNRYLLRSLLPSPSASPSFRSPEKVSKHSNNNLAVPTICNGETASILSQLQQQPNGQLSIDHQTDELNQSVAANCPVIIQCESTIDDSAYEAELEDDDDIDIDRHIESDIVEKNFDTDVFESQDPNLSSTAQCPNCQLLKYGKKFPTINLDQCGKMESNKKTWTNYLDNKLSVSQLFRKNHKFSVPTASESSTRDSSLLPPLGGSVQSAMI
ncbi:Prostaglandin E2 receptor EP4 subtype [Chamberlinius hualienensis]